MYIWLRVTTGSPFVISGFLVMEVDALVFWLKRPGEWWHGDITHRLGTGKRTRVGRDHPITWFRI